MANTKENMIDTAILETDLRAVIEDMPVSIIHKGTTISGITGTDAVGANISYMGIAESDGFTASGCVSDFTTTPAPKDAISINGEMFIITDVRTSADGVQYVMAITKQTAELGI